MAKSNLAKKLTTQEGVDLLIKILSNKAFLNISQLKRLNIILIKSQGGILSLNDKENLLNMESAIKCHLVYNSMNVNTRLNRLERNHITDTSTKKYVK